MTSEIMISLKNRLKVDPPPNRLSLIKEVADVEWKYLSMNDVDTACEIILRISADAIVCASDMNGDDRYDYQLAFLKIQESVRNSSIIGIYQEFDEYFGAYSEYLSEF